MQILPSTISHQTIENQLDEILKAQENGSQWIEYYAGSNGVMIRNWLASVATFLSYESIAYRREANPLTAKLKSSVYNTASLFGYPINRCVAAQLELTIRNTGESIYWRKENPLGSFDGSEVCLIQSQQIERGYSTLRVLVGQWNTQEFKVSDDTNYYEAVISLDEYNTDISYICNSNLTVSINNEDQPVSKFVEDVQDGKIIDQTTSNYVKLLFGGVSGGKCLVKNDDVVIEWVQIKDTSNNTNSITFSPDNYSSFDQRFVLESVEIIRRQTSEDSLQKIVKLLPGYYASRRRAVTPEDHSAIITSFPGVLSAKFGTGLCTSNELTNPNSATCTLDGGEWTSATEGCCTTKTSYLLESGKPLTDEEEEDLYKQLADKYLLEGNYLLFQPGIPVTVMPKIAVVIEPNYTNNDKLEEYINALIKEQCYELGGTFKVSKLIADINNLLGVRYCSIIRPKADMTLSWLGYFNQGSLDLTITSKDSDLLKFGSEEGGYLPYSDDPTGFLLKAFSKKNKYKIGETIVISGYVAYEGEVLADHPVVITLARKEDDDLYAPIETEEVLTNSDGTFSIEYKLDSYSKLNALDSAIVTSSFLSFNEEQVISFDIEENIYKLMPSFVGDTFINSVITIRCSLTKNGGAINNQIITVRDAFNYKNEYVTDIFGNIEFEHTIRNIEDCKFYFSYTDVYGQDVEAELDIMTQINILYSISIKTDKDSYSVGEHIIVTVELLANGEPAVDKCVFVRPVFDGRVPTNMARTGTIEENGEFETKYLVSNSLVSSLLNGMFVQFYLNDKVECSAITSFTLNISDIGDVNGIG